MHRDILDNISPSINITNNQMKILKPFYLLTPVLVLFSCAAGIEGKVLDLEDVGVNFSASAYYQKKLDNTNKIIATNPKATDKKKLRRLLDENMFVKDTLCFFSSEYSTDKYVDSKSDFVNRKKSNEGIFGYTYNTVSWSKNDSLAVLNGVYFQQLNMLENKSGELISVVAVNESRSKLNYQKLVAYLKKKYGAPLILLNNKAKQLEVLNWETKQDKVQLSTKISTIEDVLSIALDGTKEIKKETEYTIDFFKINKKHINEISKLRTGNWIISNND